MASRLSDWAGKCHERLFEGRTQADSRTGFGSVIQRICHVAQRALSHAQDLLFKTLLLSSGLHNPRYYYQSSSSSLVSQVAFLALSMEGIANLPLVSSSSPFALFDGSWESMQIYSVIPVDDDSYLVGGTVSGTFDDVYTTSAFLAQCNMHNEAEWASLILGLNDLRAAQIDDQKNIVIGGTGATVAKLTPKAEILWSRQVVNHTLESCGPALTPGGGIVMMALLGTDTIADTRVVFKLDTDGNLEWARKVQVNNDVLNNGQSIIATSKGKIVISAVMSSELSQSGGSSDLFILTFDADGTLDSAEILVGGGHQPLLGAPSDGGLMIASIDSNTQIPNKNSYAPSRLTRLDENRTLNWYSHILGVEVSRGIALMADGTTVLVGQGADSRKDGWVGAWDNQGKKLWSLSISADKWSFLSGVATTNQSDVLAVGFASPSSKDKSFVLGLPHDGDIAHCNYIRSFDTQIDYGNIPDISPLTTINITDSPIAFTNLTTEVEKFTLSINPKCIPSDSESTTDPSNQNILVWSLVAGGAVLVLGVTLGIIGGAWVLARNKKRSSQAPSTDPEIAQVPHSGSELQSQTAQSSLPVLEQGRTQIGEKYSLVRKITPGEAAALKLQTGIDVSFPEGKTLVKPLLGAGRFGKLRIAQIVETQEFLGVKKIKGPDEIAASEKEGELQKKVSRRPHLMPLLDSVETQGSNGKPVLYQFMPLAGFGNGEKLQQSLARVTDEALKRKVMGHIAFSVLEGLNGMHQCGIAHLDLKGSNIVFANDGEVFIIDFGCAEENDNLTTLTGGNGDVYYFSPMRLAYCRGAIPGAQASPPLPTQPSYSGIKADLWALGIMLLEIMNNKYPLEHADVPTRLKTWDEKRFYAQLKGVLKDANTDPLLHLIKQMLDEHSTTTAADLLQDPIFQDPGYGFSSREVQARVFAKLKETQKIHPSPEQEAPQKPASSSSKSSDQQYMKIHYIVK